MGHFAVLRQAKTPEGVYHSLHLWCPGCNDLHAVSVVGPDGYTPRVCWTWNGSLDLPTVDPSILVTYGPDRGRRVCHSFLRNGVWQFLPDCTHELAGQSVEMVVLPDWLVRDADR